LATHQSDTSDGFSLEMMSHKETLRVFSRRVYRHLDLKFTAQLKNSVNFARAGSPDPAKNNKEVLLLVQAIKKTFIQPNLSSKKEALCSKTKN
jgi:hypothetical protein